jgi:hypothetical protein
MTLRSIQPLTKMSTRNLPGGKGRLAPTENIDSLVDDVIAEVFLPSRCLETVCMTPLFHRCSARTLWETQPHLLLRVGPCLQSCCLATRWSNPLQYITPCSPLKVNQLFEWSCRLHLQFRRISQKINQREVAAITWYLNFYAKYSFETSVDFKRTTQYYIPEDRALITTAVRTSDPTWTCLVQEERQLRSAPKNKMSVFTKVAVTVSIKFQ